VTIRLAVLLSGTGRTLQNFIDLIAKGELDASIEVVLSSNNTAFGLQRARDARIPTHVVRRRDFETVEAFSDAITEVLDAYEIDLVVGAGFTQLYKYPARFEGRMLNVHPALLPEYGGQGMYGHHVHEAVIAAGEKESGCTVHLATHEYDKGAIIVQKRVPVLSDDTPDTLADRVFEAELVAYPEAIRIMAKRLQK
jgi:formyltetrahydrofolate-dependent phosphoribosylglycinamide formyltransferase